MLLTDKEVRALSPTDKSYKKADGQGLYLLIKPNGSKYWRMNYSFAKKSKTIALGVYPNVTLKQARNKRYELKNLLADGIDPAAQKRKDKLRNELAANNTFKLIAEEFSEQRASLLAQSTQKKNNSILNNDLYPYIGNLPIMDITAPDLLSTVRIIEARDSLDIAKKALQLSGQIFRYAIATGRAERDISQDLRGALKTRKIQNRAYLKEAELPEFFRKLDAYHGDRLTALALNLIVLTFLRTVELRGARWGEFDFDRAEWRIPEDRMKMKRMHIVPLPKQALAILKELKQMHGDHDYVFPMKSKPHKCMSENTMIYAMYRMGYHSKATVHGFRATASTILNENGFGPDIIERQLAHVEGNSVRAAYNHAQYLPERREMMQWWADHLDKLRGQHD